MSVAFEYRLRICSVFVALIFLLTLVNAYPRQRWAAFRTRFSPLPNHHTEPFLTPEDLDAAEQLPEKAPTVQGLMAMQNPALFEGDIYGFHPDQVDRVDQKMSDDPFSHAHHTAVNLDTFPEKLWDHGRIPYILDDRLENDERAAVAQAFEEYSQKTCVHFEPKDPQDKDYILIKRNHRLGCSSFVGRAGGNQTVSLEVGKCFTKGIIAHELMHVLGFFHEHSRTDRDKYVRILNRNVIPGMLKNFEKYSNNILDTLEMPYDYGSVMHYHKLAFSRNGQATVVPVEPQATIGQRLHLSNMDRAKVNKLYRCEYAKKDQPKPKELNKNSTCRDRNGHCRLWADLGHCRWSQSYMKTHCRQSCDLCNKANSKGNAPPSTTNAAALAKKRCKDKNLFCPYWAGIGECKNELKFMKVYCPKSCKICVSEIRN